ncbi:MAG: class II glutamine amidotransferase [Oscillospiraceae bacterium]|nr:class II glutamine amidotransferase [Oscillospiraceae bacterium]
MCAIYGFLNYGNKVHHRLLLRLIRELSIAAECRGTDATGISYIKNGEIITFKKAKPAHKLHLYFPRNTVAVIGHNRITTQGNVKKNYNNHPFNGKTAAHSFAFAHNGVLYNEAEMQKEYSLPETPIETDSYTAVQVLETFDTVDYESVKAVSEAVRGSFVFTILRDDNTIILVKGDNPLTVYCYPELGLFVYASTKTILDTAVKLAHIHTAPISYIINEGDIIRIDPDGKISVSKFEMKEDFRFDWRSLYRDSWMPEDDVSSAEILDICGYYGIEKEDVELLMSMGYTVDEIEEMLTDTDYYEATMAEAKALDYQ